MELNPKIVAKVNNEPAPTKFAIEYKDKSGKLESRWTYDLKITTAGPVLVEDFNLPLEKEVKKEKSKQK